MLNLFPTDRMQHGLGKEIFIEITRCPFATHVDRKELVKSVGRVVKKFSPNASVYSSLVLEENEDCAWSSLNA